MPVQDMQLSILLNGGQDSRSSDEIISPVLEPGSAPTLKESANTRLSGVLGTCTRAPAVTAAGFKYTVCHGLVPAANGRRTVGFYRQNSGENVVYADVGRIADNTGPLYGDRSDSGTYVNAFQNVYTPARLDALNVPSTKAAEDAVFCYDATADVIWMAYFQITDAGANEIMLAAMRRDGSLLCPPNRVVGVTAAERWLGLTAHGASGVRLWYYDTDIYMRTVSNFFGRAEVTTASTVYTPAAFMGFDVVAGQAGYAFLSGCTSGVATTGLVYQVDVSNGTPIAGNTAAGALGAAPAHSSIVYTALGGGRVVVAWSNKTGNLTRVRACTTGLATAWTTDLSGYDDTSSIGFYTVEGTPWVVVAASKYTASVDFYAAGQVAHVTVHQSLLSTGSLTETHTLEWARIHQRGAQWRLNGQEEYFLLPIYRTYKAVSPQPYVLQMDDPSVEVYMVAASVHPTPVARYGVVRGSSLPANSPSTYLMGAGQTLTAYSAMFAYRRADFAPASVYPAKVVRAVTLDFTPKQPRLAYDRDGVTLVAAAQPVYWDGHYLSELGGPLHAPRLDFDLVGGSGIPAAGLYKMYAIYRWRDAAGLLHRSKPSNIGTFTSDGAATAPVVYVSTADGGYAGETARGMRGDVVLYISGPGGTVAYEQALGYAPTVSGGVWTFSGLTNLTTTSAQLYSEGGLGEEIVPQAAPPLHDVAVVGTRVVGIDAEVRSRLVYTKRKVAGTAFEFFPAGEVVFPAGAGKLMAVSDVGGTAVVLSERAVFQLAGEGPSNTLGGAGSFGDPVRIADVGCTNTDSVISTPAGLFWQNGTWLVRFMGQAQTVPFFSVSDIAGAVYLSASNEVLFFERDTTLVYVYNTAIDKWTTWDSDTWAYPTAQVVQIPYSTDEAALATNANNVTTLHVLNGLTTGTAAHMRWDTGWCLLGGDYHSRAMVRHLVFNGQTAGSHSITLELWLDYAASPAATVTWSAAELAAVTTNGKYSVKWEPAVQTARAFRFRVYDTVSGTQGVQPRSLTIQYAVEPGMNEDAFVTGAVKGG